MSSESLSLGDQVRLGILAHAANCAPNECCGLLAADTTGGIRFAYPLTNADPSPVSYTVDPEEHFGALRHAEAQGWEIAGVFHSHPRGPATPSMMDVRTALEPDWIYLVAAPGEIRGFRIAGGNVVEVELEWTVSPTR
jgi:proteasome lid subunit RPN8/RPN11